MIQIREATLADHDAICALYAEVDAMHHEALPAVFREPGRRSSDPERFRDVLSKPDVILLVAESGGDVIGFALVSIRPGPASPVHVPRRFAFIEELVVDRAHRRHGVGTGLLRRAEVWAAAKGVREIEIHVWEFNDPARALYEKLGYATVTRRLAKALGRE